MLAVLAVIAAAVIVAIIGRAAGMGIGRALHVGQRLRRGCGAAVMGGATLDDLVQFPPVEPDAAALRAIVDLDTLTVAHHERDLADRTGHSNGGVRHKISDMVIRCT